MLFTNILGSTAGNIINGLLLLHAIALLYWIVRACIGNQQATAQRKMK